MSSAKKVLRPEFGMARGTYEELTRGRLGKSSGTYVKTTLEWNEEDNKAFRKEVEARFRERTPPQSPAHLDVMSRVTREEMESWAIQVLRKPLPQTEDWAIDFVIWYQKMMKRNAVHMKWLESALCGFKDKAIISEVESEISCETCTAIFRTPESEKLH